MTKARGEGGHRQVPGTILPWTEGKGLDCQTPAGRRRPPGQGQTEQRVACIRRAGGVDSKERKLTLSYKVLGSHRETDSQQVGSKAGFVPLLAPRCSYQAGMRRAQVLLRGAGPSMAFFSWGRGAGSMPRSPHRREVPKKPREERISLAGWTEFCKTWNAMQISTRGRFGGGGCLVFVGFARRTMRRGHPIMKTGVSESPPSQTGMHLAGLSPGHAKL